MDLLVRRLKDTENMISLTKDVLKGDKDSPSLRLSLSSLEKMERRLQAECVDEGLASIVNGKFIMKGGV